MEESEPIKSIELADVSQVTQANQPKSLTLMVVRSVARFVKLATRMSLLLLSSSEAWTSSEVGIESESEREGKLLSVRFVSTGHPIDQLKVRVLSR